jgi:hypothetical protein
MCDLEAERGLAQPARLDQSQPGQQQQQQLGQQQQQLGQQQQQLGQQQQQQQGQQQHKQPLQALSHRGPEKLLNGHHHHHPLPSFEIISKVILRGKSHESLQPLFFFQWWAQLINVRILLLL